jgi:hypothetical protein
MHYGNQLYNKWKNHLNRITGTYDSHTGNYICMSAVSNLQLWSHMWLLVILVAVLQHFNGNINRNIQEVKQEKETQKNSSEVQQKKKKKEYI